MLASESVPVELAAAQSAPEQHFCISGVATQLLCKRDLFLRRVVVVAIYHWWCLPEPPPPLRGTSPRGGGLGNQFTRFPKASWRRFHARSMGSRTPHKEAICHCRCRYEPPPPLWGTSPKGGGLGNQFTRFPKASWQSSWRGSHARSVGSRTPYIEVICHCQCRYEPPPPLWGTSPRGGGLGNGSSSPACRRPPSTPPEARTSSTCLSPSEAASRRTRLFGES